MNVPYAKTSDGEADLATLIDMNGDGLPDRVMIGSINERFDVQLNSTNGSFSGVTAWGNVNGDGPYPYSPRCRDYSHVYSELMDMNGDGLPDRVIQNGVQLNNGAGGFLSSQNWNYSGDPEVVNVTDGAYTTQFIDMNGDGLPDKVVSHGNNTYTVYFNTGKGFSSMGVTWTGVNTAGDGTTGWSDLQSWGAYGTKTMFIDMNGDGLVDRVIRNYTGTSTSLLVQFNSGPFPDLLIEVQNGMGGKVDVTYTNAAHWNNSDGTRPRLPLPVYTVTSVTVNDGIRNSGTTTYSYMGGLYDTTWREFRGFAEVTETDPLGTTNYNYFYQGGGLNFSTYGEYQDSRFKAGMPWDIQTYGSDGEFYKETFNIVDQVRVDPNGVYFPYVTNAFTFDAEPAVSARATLKQYHYAVTADTLAASTGNLLQESDLGEVTSVNTDAYGNTTYTGVPGASVYTTYAYATLSNPSIIDKPSSVTISSDSAGNNVLRKTQYYYFGTTGNLQEKSELVCPSTYANTVYTYDNYGNPLTVTDPMAIVTTMNYDSASATFLSRKYTGALTNGFQYDPQSGSLLYSTNEQGLVTANTYDGLLRLTNSAISTTPNGAATLWRERCQYNLSGMNVGGTLTYNFVHAFQNDPASSTGYHESYTYLDGLGRAIQVRDQSETNGQYRVSDIFYDPRGNVMAQTYPAFNSGANYALPTGTPEADFTTFDPIGRPQTNYPSATVNFDPYGFGVFWYATPLTGDAGSPVGPTTLAYNDGDNPWAIVVTDARNKVHKYLLDAFGRTNQIVEVVGTNDYTTTLAYNQVNDLTNITDSAGNKIAMFYDLAGHQVALADPDMGFWQYNYDLDGRLKTQTDAKSQTIKFFYSDTAGRVTRREGWNAGGQCVSTNTWAYDSNGGDTPCTVYPGQTYKLTDDEGWQKFSYDMRNRTLKSVRYLAKNGNTYTNQFTFDDADRLTSTIYPNGGPVVTNLFDAGQHLLQVRIGSTNFYTAKGYNELSQLSGVTFGNGAATTFNYFTISKRLTKILTTATGETTIQSLTNRYDTVGNVVGLQDLVSSHTNSASATITSASYDDLNRLTTATWSGYGTKNYGYSAIGNMLTNSESGSTNYIYGTIRPHCVRTANGMWFSYDQNGNVLFRSGQRLDYDVNNHLYRVINTNGVVTTFGYAGSGERLWELSGTNALQVWIGNNYEEKKGQTLFHILANGQTVCSFDKTGTNVFEYYHPDYLTSTTLQTDKNGNQIQHYEYSAFGQTRYTQSTNAFKISRLYTGQVLDDATGLYYYNARYYDPVLARFTQPDDVIQDISNPQTYNRYSYCVNNPLRFTDPSGHGVIDDALFNTGTFKSSYQLLTMHDSTGWKLVEMPVAIGGMMVGAADAAFNFATLGGKGVLEGGIKEGVKVGLEAASKEVTVKETPRIIERLDKIEATAKDSVHGNSKLSAKPQHRYEIVENETEDVAKTGISGQPINKNGSPRANQQVNSLNRAAGYEKYSAVVKETGIPGRQAALDIERSATKRLVEDGNSLPLQQRPKLDN
jgi:RHS repeat-associated protein